MDLIAVLTSNTPAGGPITFIIPIGVLAAISAWGFFQRKRIS